MKTLLYILLLIISIFQFNSSFAQSYSMTNGGSIVACSGTFYDSGGAAGDYANSQDFTYTICPSTPGSKVTVNFTTFDTENNYELLTIYDGNSIAAPTLGSYTGSTGPGMVSATAGNATGCLTFVFHSDGSVNYTGWVGIIACSIPCQTITANLVSTVPVSVASLVRICQGASVTFNGSGTFSTSGVGAVYTWTFGDGTSGTGTTVSHTYAAAGSYVVNLSITTAGGCHNNNSITEVVQVSTTPSIVTAVTPNPICLGQSANLTAAVTMTPYVPNCTPPVSGTTFLPDGSGVSYSTQITVNCFNAAQTITSAANIANVCLSLEHSYLGDLNIVLVCPNGQSMILKAYPGGNGTYLGAPLDDPAVGPGTGWNYCFTPAAGTLLVNGATTLAGSPASGSINAGNYMPVQPFTNLIGCPLNGAWTIQVTDNLGADNGYIFNWDVNFNVAPAAGTFTPTIVSQGWSAATGLTSTGLTTATITPTAAGTPCYVYSVTDNFGCTYTQTQCITVNPNVPVNAGPDVSGCPGAAVTIGGAPSGPVGMTYSWVETGANANIAISGSSTIANPSVLISAGATGSATYTVTGTSAGCVTTDIVVVTVVAPPITSAGPDVTICAGSSTILTASGATTYIWSPATGLSGTSTASVTSTPAATITYTVTGTTAGCTSTDQVIVTVTPLNTIAAGINRVTCLNSAITSIILATTGATGATITGLPAGVTGAWAGNVVTISGTPTISGTFNYTVTTTGGCPPATTTGTITVNPLNTIAPGTSQTLCVNSPITTISLATTGATGATFSGLPAGVTGAWAGNVATISGTPTASGTFNYTVTTTGGCPPATTTGTITVTPLNTIAAGTSPALCINTPLTAITMATTGATGATFSGLPAGVTGLWAANVATISGTPTASGTFNYAVTTTGGCPPAIATGTITVNPLPIVGAGVDQIICIGASVTLTGSGASTYTWNNGVTNGVAFSPAATTTYTVTGTSAAGCINTDQVIVTVNPLPVVVANDLGVCAGGTLTLTASGASTYTWSPGTYLSTTTGASVSCTPLATITYTVSGTSAAGCVSTDPITVTVSGSAAINAGPDVAICVGATTTLTATGGVTYNWNNALGLGNNFVVSPVATTTYTVVGTDAGGCTGTDAVTITVNPVPIVNAGLDQTVCAGTAVTLTGSGASTYTWNNGVTNAVAFVPAVTTTYTVTGTSLAGCINTDQVIVTVNPLPIVNAGVDQTICAGTAVTLTGSGASTYTWTGGITNGVAFTPASTANYTVTGTSAAGCIATDIVTVTVNPLPITNAGLDQTICIGASVTLSGSGASTYTWDNGITNGLAFSPVATVTYTVTGTSVAGCVLTDQVLVTVNPLPVVNAGLDQTVCAGIAVTLSGSGASTYTWNNGVTNGIAFTPIATTTYTVTGTSVAGCINTDQVIVTVNPLPIVNAGLDQTVCAGTAVTLAGAGASTYSWTGGVINGVAFTPATTANYTVTGTSSAGCTSTDIVTVTVNPLPTTNAGVDQTVCSGTSVTLTAIGATTYTWNNGVTNGIAFIPAVGSVTYTVTGTTGAGCTTTDQVIVTVNPNPVPVINGPSAYCTGNFALLSTSAPFTTYSWSTGALTPTINATIANNPISVTVTNGFGCIGTSPVFPIVENTVITANFTNTICQGQSSVIHGVSQTVAGVYSQTFILATGCDSVANVTLVVNPLPVVNAGIDQTVCTGVATILSGSGASTYTWNNGITNGISFTQAIGSVTYTATGTSTFGCVNTDQVIVTVNPLPVINAGPNQAICIGASATISGSGGSTYTWNNGVINAVSFTPAITNTYTVTGTDVNGCVSTDQVVVTVNLLPLVNAGLDQTICIGASVTLSGANASTYTWNNGITNALVFAPASTLTYTVSGTDINGCINTDQVVVTVNPLPIVNAGLDQTICIGASATLNGSGASSYTWNNAVLNNVTFSPVATMTYTVTGTDVNGCINTDQAIITVNSLPIVNAGLDQAICIGASTTISGSGASTYTWNNGVTNGVSFSPAITNTYTVAGTDLNGCINTDQVIVTVNPLPPVNAGVDQVTCIGGIVTLSGAGASTYTWNNGITNALAFSPVATATYTVTGTDGNGCINTDQVIVTVNPLPAVNAGVDQIVCFGTSVTLTGTGANTYTWDNAITNGVSFVPAVGTLTYTVTGTSGANCIATDQVDVTVNPIPVVGAGIDQAVCAGVSVTLSGSGASTYTWDNGILNGISFVPLTTTTYTVTGTSAFGCTFTDQVVVTVNPIPNVFAGNDLVLCENQTATLTGSGATTYTWDNGVSNGVTFTPSVGTLTYTVTGTTAFGCTNTDQLTILVNPLPAVSFMPGVTLGCVPLTTSLTNTSPNSVNCVWTISNGDVLTGCGPLSATFNQPGCYDITLTTTDINGCSNSFTSIDIVCTEAYPVAAFSPSESVMSTINTEVLFTNNSIGASDYSWDLGDNSPLTNVVNPLYTYLEQEGTYVITLIATTPLGCADTAYATIQINEALLFYVPNTFTPDDDDYNPVFQPVFTSGFDPYDYTFLIFNRWGEVIFESHDASIGWNGSYGSNGEIVLCEDGTYTWKIEFKTSLNDERKMIVGHLNLIR